MSFTSDLRERLKKRIGICPTCGQPTATIRQASEAIGIPPANLWRFLGGRSPSAETIDAVVKWLESRER